MRTTVHEVADRIYRLSTCVPDAAPGGFTFNQFLIDADVVGPALAAEELFCATAHSPATGATVSRA